MITVSLLQFVSLIYVEGGTVSLIYPPNHQHVQIYHVNLYSSFVQVILGPAREAKIMLKRVSPAMDKREVRFLKKKKEPLRVACLYRFRNEVTRQEISLSVDID
ncbi:uncharacterized protein A4U43_C09F5710 [Asparagus officinalis]|uniref:Uncharacterized protein n=1 Tax=Asparagus officinalis TaxID=4686 RepID=A0A5P1E8X6_ASPOF|nr:uncharacterized protein A4U43_C09F5710 [Asparagus officinalis]